MSITFETFRVPVAATVEFLSQPVVKETVKKISGVAAATFGIIEAYDLYMVFRGKRAISDEHTASSPRWMQIGHKIAMLTLKLSIVLNGMASRPCVYIAGKTAGLIFSETRLAALIGTNTAFTVNPWHPKHILSLGATLCGLPASIQSTYRSIVWLQSKITGKKYPESKVIPTGGWMSDTKARMIAHINMVLGRPFLHGVHLIVQRIYPT